MTTAKERLLESIETNLGPQVTAALADPRVIEIMLNPDSSLWVERFGLGMERVGTIAPDKAEVAIRFIASLLRTEVSEQRPRLKGELPLDDSRFQGMLPPVVERPSFSIRKKAARVFTLADYVAAGNLAPEAKAILEEAVAGHKNIVVAGGTGSGKTTFGNALIEAIARLTPDDRLVVIEDTRELQPKSHNVFCLKTSDTVTMDDLLVDSLRLRPDRILVGEVRDGAALTMVNAWNTGHDGGLATVHANSAEETLGRIEDMIALGTFIPATKTYVARVPVPRAIGRAINYVVFMEKALGRRQVTAITAVGYEGGYKFKTIYRAKGGR